MIIKDKENFDKQEIKDYEVAKNILEDLFKDKMVQCIKAEEFSPQDCFFSAKTSSNQIIPYDLEIKAIYNTKFIDKKGFVLKFTKYIGLMQAEDNRRVYILYFIPSTREYYIFNVRRINLNKVEKVNLKMKVKQYIEDSPTCEFAILYLKKEDAVCSGKYTIKN